MSDADLSNHADPATEFEKALGGYGAGVFVVGEKR
jgi:hypothetical protein